MELKGAALVSALRTGGFVLFMRHADAGESRPECPNESSLTPEGEAEARQVGTGIKVLGIPISSIQVSQTCRTRQTAELLRAGPLSVNSDLNPPALRKLSADHPQRFDFLLQEPPPGSNILLVSHIQGATNPLHRILIDQAEIVVYQRGGEGTAVAVARIKAQAWADLHQSVAPVK